MPTSLAPALAAVGRPESDVERHPVLHGNGETLVTFGRPDSAGTVQWSGIWISATGLEFLGVEPAGHGASRSHRLSGPAAQLFDLVVDIARVYLERIEELDQQLSEAQQRGRMVPLPDIWRLQRRTALLRAQIGRSLVALAEVSGPFGTVFPGLTPALPSLQSELGRVQTLCVNLQQALSDLILLRNAEESNRIAESANELARISNRIASLANTSNIRMLGLTYIALFLGLVSAIVLFPNTAATILGMPSAAWVPGLLVDAALVGAAVVPLVVVLRSRWVRTMLRGLPEYEERASEGVADLPELSADPNPREPPRGSQRL
ncbi:MAG TPA: hypothetical protein VEY07_08295 [Thermoplasmata archaeon]|nr:hypothetical protein [Thermoplasmata archaeon]